MLTYNGLSTGVVDLAVPVMVAIPPAGRRAPCQVLLGETFASLEANVRRSQTAPLAAEGILDVQHGARRLTPLLIRLMNLPAAGRAQSVRLDLTPIGDEVEWSRRIGSSVMRTRQRAAGSLLLEEHGIGRVAFALGVEDGALLYRQVWMQVAGIPIPSFVRPRVSARVSPAARGWRVEVTITWRGDLVCGYAGVLRAV